MVYRGKVKKGVIVLEDESELPDGTEVLVRPVKTSTPSDLDPQDDATVRRKLMKFSGMAAGLPKDASLNIDHYLYGHPKK